MLAGGTHPAWAFGGFPTFRIGPNGTMQPGYMRTADGRIVPVDPNNPNNNPWASLQPIALSRPPAGDTGPAAIVVIAAGAGSGLAWVKRKRRKGSAAESHTP
ncbi:hypothetical protein A3C37_00115 [Candidatus Peribacteria bacterium RIFCSPHIGHO2_02_FULL_53_20]|nr:MAG: hypothetical protein A3C37_00115 [Candidatus Peribacteria bacterium RIFCSPHIGHO2_02_FULL_53_20]OGJ68172.1 MAG: hypothetical protein A3B61_05175 [Candidatus Peribacteria bacterium RIFCSPLOWO2_01_FULL_53_10]